MTRRAIVVAVLAFVVVYAGLALLALPLAYAQHRWPASSSSPPDSSQRYGLRERRLDYSWWLFSPLVTGTFTRSVTWGVVAAVAYASGRGAHVDAMLSVLHEHSPLPFARLPLVAQAPLALLVADVVGYWTHRARHSRALWWFHQVHHSPRALDFLVAARMHPVDDLVDNVVVGLGVLVCGFDPVIISFLGPALILHTLVIHADVAWDFGPLRTLLASPAFHRWHHARASSSSGPSASSEAAHGNYAQLFPFVDALFGTLRFPREPATSFGVADDIPATLSGQLAWPVVRAWRSMRGEA